MIEKRKVCDVCGESPSQAYPAWKKIVTGIAAGNGELKIVPGSETVRNVKDRSVIDVCGAGCAIKAVSQWLSFGSIVPADTVQAEAIHPEDQRAFQFSAKTEFIPNFPDSPESYAKAVAEQTTQGRLVRAMTQEDIDRLRAALSGAAAAIGGTPTEKD